jgi:hypothetical protein
MTTSSGPPWLREYLQREGVDTDAAHDSSDNVERALDARYDT